MKAGAEAADAPEPEGGRLDGSGGWPIPQQLRGDQVPENHEEHARADESAVDRTGAQVEDDHISMAIACNMWMPVRKTRGHPGPFPRYPPAP
ncbi:hypothetical protein GCM10025778_05120 [Paeniglutamicibacter antarcticus]|uniref:Uncharacterized protein n=1 Tax=Paeniglutamicibacter antarcticus TaxID=494023 RepID=A0ABP9TJN6_9MICC